MKITIDYRSHLVPIRDQGERSTCVAFATSDGHSLQQSIREMLSPEYLYYHSGSKITGWDSNTGITLESASLTLETLGQPLEEHCSYRPAGRTLVPSVKTKSPNYRCKSHIADHNAEELYGQVSENRLFVLAISITRSFQTAESPFVIDAEEAEIIGKHAVLLVGLGRDQDQNLFLIRNSWGQHWANDGYAWLTTDYLQKHLIGSLEILKAG